MASATIGSKTTKSSDWLTAQLESQRTTFDDKKYPLSTYQTRQFEAIYQLLLEDERSLKNALPDRRSRRIKIAC
jgi:hypothetical protein